MDLVGGLARAGQGRFAAHNVFTFRGGPPADPSPRFDVAQPVGGGLQVPLASHPRHSRPSQPDLPRPWLGVVRRLARVSVVVGGNHAPSALAGQSERQGQQPQSGKQLGWTICVG